MTLKDYYKLLEIERSATQEEIKQAYRLLAQQYHPDKTAHLGIELREAASRKMLELNEAFQTLSDQQQRQEYDLELMKAEQGQVEGEPTPSPPPRATGGAGKTDFWRDLERIEAERAAAERAAAARAPTEEAAKAAAESEQARAKSAAPKTVTRNVTDDYVDKFCRAVAQTTGAKWTRDELPGWSWVLASGDWRKSYSIGYMHVENLGMIGLRRVFSRTESLMEKKKSALKQSHFLILVSYDRIMDTQQVMDHCRSWAAESRKDGQRLLVLLDAAKLSSILYGVPEEARLQSVVKLLGTRA